jgi:protein-tyrosine phosphatase
VDDVIAPNSEALSAYGSLKRAYTTARNFPDRVLHSRRRSEARRRVLQLERARSILVVCYGNVCRSPNLEAVLCRALPGIQVTSAGFVGPGRQVPTNSLTLASQRGIDLTEFRSRPLSRANAASADLVIVMDAGQGRHISQIYSVSPARVVVAGDLDPVVSPTREILDPWGQSLDVFTSSFNRLDRCAATLIALVRRGY